MHLYHYYRSSASFRVRIALALKRLTWDAMPIHLGNGEHRNEPYRSLAPSETVPLLIDGALAVSQSVAIVEYLDERYPAHPLLPSLISDRAYVRELALDIACEIHPLNNTRVLTFLSRLGVDEDGRNRWYRHWTELGLGVVEKKLAKDSRSGRFCFGDSPTMADCFLVPQIFNAKRFDCDLAAIPRVMAVFEECMARPEFSDNQPSAFDPLVVANPK